METSIFISFSLTQQLSILQLPPEQSQFAQHVDISQPPSSHCWYQGIKDLGEGAGVKGLGAEGAGVKGLGAPGSHFLSTCKKMKANNR